MTLAVTSHPTTLYRFFDAEGALLYVGITGRGPRRWVEHAAEKPWWSEVARTSTTHYATRSAALQAETDAIRSERPRHNLTPTYTPKTSEQRGIGRRVHMRQATPHDPHSLIHHVLDAKAAAEYMGLSHPDRLHVTAMRFPGELEPAISRGRYIRLWLRQDLDVFLKAHPDIGRKARDAGSPPS